jgi:hypothetical protein
LELSTDSDDFGDFCTMADVTARNNPNTEDLVMAADIPAFALPVGSEWCVVEVLAVEPAARVAVVRLEERAALEALLAGCSPERSLLGRPPVPGQAVAALSSGGSYLRAVVDSVQPAPLQTVRCTALDGGPVGEVMERHLSSLAPLPPACRELPRLAGRVRLFPSPLGAAATAATVGGRFRLRLVTAAAGAGLPLVELAALEAPDGSVSSSGASSGCGPGCLELIPGRLQELTVLHVQSARELYLGGDQEELRRLQTHVFSVGESLTPDPAFRPPVGALVLARSAQDGYWYRALVRAVHADSATVFCADFGFLELVPLAEVRKLNRRLTFARQAFLAARCLLADWGEAGGADSARELASLKRQLPVSAKKIKVQVLERTEEGFLVQVVGVLGIHPSARLRCPDWTVGWCGRAGPGRSRSRRSSPAGASRWRGSSPRAVAFQATV